MSLICGLIFSFPGMVTVFKLMGDTGLSLSRKCNYLCTENRIC